MLNKNLNIIAYAIACFLTTSCSNPTNKLIGVESAEILGVMQTRYIFADATSIRHNGNKSTINYKILKEESEIKELKKKYREKFNMDMNPVIGWSGTVEFDCENSLFEELSVVKTMDNGVTESIKLSSGRVLPNDVREKLMKYSCMASLKRGLIDRFAG